MDLREVAWIRMRESGEGKRATKTDTKGERKTNTDSQKQKEGSSPVFSLHSSVLMPEVSSDPEPTQSSPRLNPCKQCSPPEREGEISSTGGVRCFPVETDGAGEQIRAEQIF